VLAVNNMTLKKTSKRGILGAICHKFKFTWDKKGTSELEIIISLGNNDSENK